MFNRILLFSKFQSTVYRTQAKAKSRQDTNSRSANSPVLGIHSDTGSGMSRES